MATNPSRSQRQARDNLSEALNLITGANRLDGRGTLDGSVLGEITRLAARASSAFTIDQIIAGTLERRARALNLPSSAAELLMLIEANITPLEMLLLNDDEFKALVEKMQDELGDL